MRPAEQSLRFCSVLFADLTDQLTGLYATVWLVRSTGKATRWLPAHDPAAIASAIGTADAEDATLAVYVGMGMAATAGPRNERPTNRRPTNNEVGAITCVWVDLDVAGPAHDKKDLPPTVADAHRVLDAVGLPPTMVWGSGHGLQAVWCLAEPLTFTPGSPDARAAAELTRDWVLTVAMHAHRLGRWSVDRVHDLARVLRAPGSTNRKIDGDHRPVELLTVDEAARYSVDDLLAHTADREYLNRFAGMTARTDGAGAGSVDLDAVWALVTSAGYRARRYEPEWLSGLVTEGVLSDRDTLVKVFRSGHDSGDPSSRDASLVRCLADVRVGGEHVYDERDAVELVMCARLRDGVKVDKVDPRSRRDYVVRTVDKIWGESDRVHAERVAARAAGRAAVAAQDAATAGNGAVPGPLPALSPDDPDRPAVAARGMGAAIAAELAAASAAVVPDHPTPAEATDLEPSPGPGPGSGHGADGDGGWHEAVRPMGSPWGTRTESQHRELTALSATLLGVRAEHVQIWRCQYRGKGARQERRILFRIAADYRWSGPPPEAYVPGTLLASGWWPAKAFSRLGGWVLALRQDCQVITEPVSNEEFDARFADTLVRVWEPDTSGGSLANVTREAMGGYLLDYPPTSEWQEAVAQGTPFIVQRQPRWSLASRFTVLVHWAGFARHVRARHAVNVTPAVAAEMAELSGSLVVPTVTQDGQWHVVRREYLGDTSWSSVLHNCQLAEARRDERRGLYVVGAQDAPGDGDDDPGLRRSAPGGAR